MRKSDFQIAKDFHVDISLIRDINTAIDKRNKHQINVNDKLRIGRDKFIVKRCNWLLYEGRKSLEECTALSRKYHKQTEEDVYTECVETSRRFFDTCVQLIKKEGGEKYAQRIEEQRPMTNDEYVILYTYVLDRDQWLKQLSHPNGEFIIIMFCNQIKHFMTRIRRERES